MSVSGYVGIILAVVFVGLIGGLIYYVKTVDKANKQWQTVMNKNEQIGKDALKYLGNHNFTPSHICYLSDYASVRTTEKSKKQMLCVDTEKEKLAFINYTNGEVTIADFSQLINYEVYENGKTDSSSSGVVLGGSVAVPYVTTATQEQCLELKLLIRLDSFDKPHVEYILIANTLLNGGADKSKSTYRAIRDELQQTVSYLEMILRKQKSNKQ